MYDMQKLDCHFKFTLNDVSMQVLISCHTAASYIVGIFLVDIETLTVRQIFSDNEE